MNIYFWREIEHFGTVKDRGTAMKINEFARKNNNCKKKISTLIMGSESVLQQEESNSIHNTAISEKEKYEVNVNKMFKYQFSLIFSE